MIDRCFSSICVALLSVGVALPAASEQRVAPEEFLAAMTRCLDWIAADLPDEAPFSSWDVGTAFPAGRDDEGAEAGSYVLPGTGFTVSLLRGDERADCVGQGGGPTQGELGAALNTWVGAEIDAGRIGLVEQGVAEFGYPLAICVGPEGGLDLIREEDEELMFYFQTGQATPPEGVCDA